MRKRGDGCRTTPLKPLFGRMKNGLRREPLRGRQLVLRVRNSFRSDSGRHPFTRRPGRGYDLGNVRRVVAQYGGTMEVSANVCFTFSAMLPLQALKGGDGIFLQYS